MGSRVGTAVTARSALDGPGPWVRRGRLAATSARRQALANDRRTFMATGPPCSSARGRACSCSTATRTGGSGSSAARCATAGRSTTPRSTRRPAPFAAGGSPWYGPAVWRSDDLGATWTHSSEGLTYGDDGPKIAATWNLTRAGDVLYAGVQPAGLFRSRDGGATAARRGPDEPSNPVRVAARRRRPVPPFDRPPPR